MIDMGCKGSTTMRGKTNFFLVLLLAAVNIWRETGYGSLDYAKTMRLVVPGATP
jgi:hypothetical protein